MTHQRYFGKLGGSERESWDTQVDHGLSHWSASRLVEDFLEFLLLVFDHTLSPIGRMNSQLLSEQNLVRLSLHSEHLFCPNYQPLSISFSVSSLG